MHTEKKQLSIRGIVEAAGFSRLRVGTMRNYYELETPGGAILTFRITIVSRTVHLTCYDLLTTDEVEIVQDAVREIEKASEFLAGYSYKYECYLSLIEIKHRGSLDSKEEEVPELLRPLLSKRQR